MFARGGNAIVTRRTDPYDLGMIHRIWRDRYPGHRAGLVTGIAKIGRLYVQGRLARGDNTVMTTDTGTVNLGMVYRGRCNGSPGRRSGLMTGIAAIGGCNMIGCFTRGRHSIMTGDACANNLCVIHCRGNQWHPGYGTGLVTAITGIG